MFPHANTDRLNQDHTHAMVVLMAANMKRLAVLTSGGDAPGMNAAIRAVVHAGMARGFAIHGIDHGFTGLINGNFRALDVSDVDGIIQHAGTVLGTTRCEALRTESGCAAAIRTLKENEISTLIVVGGNGSQTGAWELARRGVSVIGIASTIDNDLFGTDISIGATTAIDVVLEAIGRLRATAGSMRRAFLLEVMGRHCGYIALMAGIVGGAEAIVAPEINWEPARIMQTLFAAHTRGKSHAIVVVAEGASHNAQALMNYFHDHADALQFELRATTLGHVQRGAAPGVFDRMLGIRLGVAAIEAAAEQHHGVLMGWRDGKPASTPLADVANHARPADGSLIDLAKVFAM